MKIIRALTPEQKAQIIDYHHACTYYHLTGEFEKIREMKNPLNPDPNPDPGR